MSNETMRTAFEREASIYGWNLERDSQGDYVNIHTSNAFEFFCDGANWQAARAQIAKPVPEGFVGRVAQIMQDRWCDWVNDTECVPDDFEIKGPPTTQVYFTASNWAYQVAQDIKAMLTAAPQPPAQDWFLYGERLPDEDDEDCEGNVWNFMPGRSSAPMLTTAGETRRRYETGIVVHWKPTGLERPEPPEE